MHIQVVSGDLLQQPVDAIVNAWNRNIIPWWMLIPHGVSGAIKRYAGTQPFRELARVGILPLGAAVATSAGHLPHSAIIHVASIDLWWRSSEAVVRLCVENALRVAEQKQIHSLAFPMLGAGSGNIPYHMAEQWMMRACAGVSSDIAVTIVHWMPGGRANPIEL